MVPLSPPPGQEPAAEPFLDPGNQMNRPGRTSNRLASRRVAGGLGAAVMALALAVPGVAQEAAPRLDIEAAPVEACQAAHFEPARYRAALEEAGWEIARPEWRSDAIVRLADAFEPLAQPPEAESPAALRAHRAANRAEWFGLVGTRMLMLRPGAVLFVAGYVSSEGDRAVECWVAMADPRLVDGLVGRVAETRPNVARDSVSSLSFGPYMLEDGARFSLLAVRHLPGSETDAPGEAGPPPPAATHGFMTRTILPPASPENGKDTQ